MRTVGEYDERYLRRQRPLWLFLKIVGVLVGVSLLVGAVAWGCGWFRTGAHVVSAQNVKEQWRFAYDYHESLKAAAGNVCQARADEASAATAAEEKVQRRSQRAAYEQVYRKIQAEYDGRLADAFRAKLVKPADVPNRAPTLDQMLVEVRCPGAETTVQPAPTSVPTG